MKTFLILVGCLAAACGVKYCPDCNWEMIGSGGEERCWLHVRQLQIYPLAAEHCRDGYRGALMTFRDSSDVTEFLSRWTRANMSSEVWFGLRKVNSTYIWEDGMPWTYRNWKAGEEPIKSDEACAAVYRATGLWTSKLHCITPRHFICEVPALRFTCPFERLEITQGVKQTWETANATIKRTTMSFVCDIMVYVKNPSTETIFVKMTYFAGGNAVIRIKNYDTGIVISRIVSPGVSWAKAQIATNVPSIRIEMLATEGGALGATFVFETEQSCTPEYYKVSQILSKKWETENASLRKTVTAIQCTKDVGVLNTSIETVNVAVEVYATSNAYVRLVNSATGQEIKRYTNTGGVWLKEVYSTELEAIRMEAFAPGTTALGASLTFQATRCPPGEMELISTQWKTWHTKDAALGKTVTDGYYCVVNVRVVQKDKYHVLVTGQFYADGNAYVRIVNAATQVEIRRHTNSLGLWKSLETITRAPAVRIEVYAPGTARVGVKMSNGCIFAS